MFDDDNINDSYAGVDAVSAKASQVKKPDQSTLDLLKAQAISMAEAAKTREHHLERLRLQVEPVEPGKMAKRGQPDIPYYGSLCAVSKCRGLSEGGYVEISPKSAYEDPVKFQPEELSDEQWEEEAFNQAEETRLRALGYSTDLLTQVEHAQRFVGAAQAATQFVTSVVLPLCPFHAENRDATISAGFKSGALPLRFGHQ